MSKIQVDTIVNKNDDGAPTFTNGVVVAGITTVTTLNATTITATNYTGIPVSSDWRDNSLF
jgi:hypothetical protein